MERIVTMLVRMVARRLVRHGLRKGIDLASRHGSEGGEQGRGHTPKQARGGADPRQMGRRAGQAMRILRRFGRF